MDGSSEELKLEVKDEGAEPAAAADAVDSATVAVHTPAAQARPWLARELVCAALQQMHSVHAAGST